ncbi:glycoside hydrolase family 3 C-terminal domain-containing protein [Planomonospora sp. ID67723]|uniref:glycoside hydrolase family 3 protein n=1 Tax=Planomonospora sp. ID67723 TaxID=2738134 RepID=UPI0018C38879|nr:glycoside hydrolase family 3 N-terminal domain-containing protein [Planomonospora sp. ID67723]MBG0829389.1 glycoside hydrolase family 3 C-terminal domain-containing protein [Planomonospora sp. ID67723]
MPPYQDPALPVEERVTDLLERMTLQEKAGLMFHTMLAMNTDGSPVEDPAAQPGGVPTTEMVQGRLMSHFNLLGGAGPRQMAQWHNRLQEMAAETRLGIPVTVSTDPRHAFTDNPGTAMLAGAFSRWPETTGLAAIGDAGLVRRYADVVRREYLAVGIRVALHPQIDLATEPRWSRISGTFGADAGLTSRLVTAYLEGMRGPGSGAESVACMVKHFPGGGPQKDGEDPHFAYGKEQVYPGGNFDYHLAPFRAAIAAGATQIMPYYGVPVGTAYEEVGFGFNKQVVTGLLREELGFDGIVCTDWQLLNDTRIGPHHLEAKAWGVEHLTPAGRALKAIEAGADQFGGEACPELIVELVRGGLVGEDRIDASVRRLLREKFRLGLFEHRFADPDRAEEIVGSAEFRTLGESAQRRCLTVLTGDGVLPLPGRPRLYAEGVDAAVAAEYAEPVADPAAADVALLRLPTPHEPRTGGFFETFFRAGSLAFDDERLEEVLAVLEAVPTVVVIRLERPAVIPEIAARAAALIGEYGADDRAVLDVVFGRAAPRGRLPFELPRSMEEVRRSRPDVPGDTRDPLFPLGHGLDIAI